MQKTAPSPNSIQKNVFSPHEFSLEEMRAKILHKLSVKFPKFWGKQNKEQNAGSANGLFLLDTVEKLEETRKASQKFQVFQSDERLP